MVAYRYLSTYLGGDNSKIAELKMRGVAWQRLRNGAGVMQGTIKLPPPVDEFNRSLAELYKSATDRGTTCIYVLRNNVPMGAYAVWTQDYDSATQEISVGGLELSSYFKRRIIEKTDGDMGLDDKVIYDGQPMYDTVSDMIQKVNEIGLILDIESGGPTLPTTIAAVPGGAPEIPGTGWRGVEAKWVGDVITEWANQDDGYDFRTDLVLSGGSFQRRFILRESLGNKADIVAKYGGLVAKAGGNVTSFKVSRRGDVRSNDVISVGATSISELGKRYNGRETIGAFVPTLQNIYQQNEETDTARLDAYAIAALAATKNHEVIELEVAAEDVDAQIGTFMPGDEFRFMVAPNSDAFFSAGLDTTVKTIGFKVTVPDTESKEMVSFQLEESPFG